MKKQIILSFAINILGLFSIFFVDVKIASLENDLLVSSWALTKSVLFIGIIFILLGLDQAIVRLKLELKEILTPATIQFGILVSILTLGLNLAGTNVNIYTIASTLFILALLYLLYAEYRLNLKYTIAQFSVNGWRFIFLILILIFGYTEFNWLLPLSVLIAMLYLTFKRKLISNFKIVVFKSYKRILNTGLHYFIALLTLTLTLYIDQILLNFDGKILESSVLFSHITFFVSPNAILIGFGGFLITPYLKKNPEKKAYFLKKYLWLFILVVCVIVIASFFVGIIMFNYFKQDQNPSIMLAIGLSVVAFLRYLNILPSGYIGSFASNKLIRTVASVNFAGILFYILTYFIISRFVNGHLVAILSAILVVWLIRIFIGYVAILRIIKQNEPV